MSGKGLRIMVSALAIGCLAIAGARADDNISNKWRIECSGSAHSDGTIQLRVTPHQGTPSNVNVAVADKTSENKVAQDIRDALIAQLPTGEYRVETDDGEDVLIKKAKSQLNFSVEVVSSNVEHLKVHVEKE